MWSGRHICERVQKAKWNYPFDIGFHEDGVFNQDIDVDAVWEVLKQVSCNDIHFA